MQYCMKNMMVFMEEDQLFILIYSLDRHNLMTMGELTKEMVELMDFDQLFLSLYSLYHRNLLSMVKLMEDA